MIEEAGGKICDINGAPLDFSKGRTLKANKGVIVTNAFVHEQVMHAVKTVLNKHE